MKRFLVFFLCAIPVFSQSSTGELRLKVIDSSGLGVRTVVELASDANQFHQVFETDEAGDVTAKRLPFDFGGDVQDALAQYGPQVVNRVNFDTGRVRPSLSVSASAGVDLYKTERSTMGMQVDGENLNNRLNVIDFGGLFSGNAIGPARSVNAHLKLGF